jgi:hypothetical protein
MDFIFKLLIIIVLFIWLIPPFQQYKERFFYFFLILAIIEVSAVFFNKTLKVNSTLIYILGSSLLFISLFSKKDILKYWFYFLSVVVLSILTYFIFNNEKLHFLIIIFVHLIILFRILLLFITEIEIEKIIKIFLIVFLFYEFTVIFKFVILITGIVDAYPYFIFTSVFEIFIGLFFSIFKEDDTRIILKLK